MSDILEFLKARIAEDEALARAALEPSHPYGDKSLPQIPAENWGREVDGYLGGSWGEHAAQWNPLRVLAECEAKHALLIEHFSARWAMVPHGCRVCRSYGAIPDAYPCVTVRVLAGVYAGHPDYRAEWSLMGAEY